MLKPKTRRNIRRLLPYPIIWIFTSCVFIVVELAASGNYSQLPDTAIRMDRQIFIWSTLAIGTVGLLTGLIELKYLHYRFAGQNFMLRVLYKLFVYSAFFMLVVLLTYPIAVSLELNAPLTDSRV